MSWFGSVFLSTSSARSLYASAFPFAIASRPMSGSAILSTGTFPFINISISWFMGSSMLEFARTGATLFAGAGMSFSLSISSSTSMFPSVCASASESADTSISWFTSANTSLSVGAGIFPSANTFLSTGVSIFLSAMLIGLGLLIWMYFYLLILVYFPLLITLLHRYFCLLFIMSHSQFLIFPSYCFLLPALCLPLLLL